MLAPFVGVVGTAMFAAGVWVAAGGRGAGFDRREELLGGLFFAAMGLLCVYGAMVIWQRGEPRRHPRLRRTTLSVDGETLHRGDEISVTLSSPQTNDDRLEVGLACDERFDTQVRVYVRGASTVRRQTGEVTVYERWQPVAPGVDGQTFRFTVPTEAPYSYEGDCVSFAWRVSARAVRPLRKDPRVDRPIWVEP
jgi:hypothetical protein